MSAALILIGLISAICFLVWYFESSKFRRLINQIPGPPCLPIIGNAHQMSRGPEWYLQVMSWGQKYKNPGILKLWLVNKPIIGVATPEMAEVLLNSSRHIDKASEYDFLHVWLGTGLLTSTGSKWRSRRKMLTPTFHFRILHDFVDVFNRQSDVLVNKLQGRVGKGPFNVFQDIALCALDIICETAMGQHVSAQTQDSEYVRAVYRICGLVENRMRSPLQWNKVLFDLFGPGHEHDKCLKTLHDFTVKVIKERMKTFDRKQAASVLADTSKSTEGDENEIEKELIKPSKIRLAFLDMLIYMSDNGKFLSVDDIQEEVDTFMFEGHDTTAAAMNWCVFLVGSNTNIQEKLHKEMDSIFGDSDRKATMEDLKEMKYLECCIKEALRLYPSVPMFGRTTTEDVKLGEYLVPKGITCIIFTSSIHRDDRYFPNPEVFDPDRFLPENITKRHPYSYIPFSAGPRNCIGQKFALLEEKVILSSIFRNFNMKSCQQEDNLLPVGELILRPQNGITIQLSSRKAAA